MSWFELLKTLRGKGHGKDEHWLMDVTEDEQLVPSIPPEEAQDIELPYSPDKGKHPKRNCRKGQKWCPKCNKCTSIAHWKQHNQSE